MAANKVTAVRLGLGRNQRSGTIQAAGDDRRLLSCPSPGLAAISRPCGRREERYLAVVGGTIHRLGIEPECVQLHCVSHAQDSRVSAVSAKSLFQVTSSRATPRSARVRPAAKAGSTKSKLTATGRSSTSRTATPLSI